MNLVVSNNIICHGWNLKDGMIVSTSYLTQVLVILFQLYLLFVTTTYIYICCWHVCVHACMVTIPLPFLYHAYNLDPFIWYVEKPTVGHLQKCVSLNKFRLQRFCEKDKRKRGDAGEVLISVVLFYASIRQLFFLFFFYFC